jgi:hypothetical protein
MNKARFFVLLSLGGGIRKGYIPSLHKLRKRMAGEELAVSQSFTLEFGAIQIKSDERHQPL